MCKDTHPPLKVGLCDVIVKQKLFLIPNIVFFLSGSYINILLLLSKPSEWLLLKYELSST